MDSRGLELQLTLTEDLVAALEELSPEGRAALPSTLDALTRTYAELSATIDELSSTADRIRKMQGRVFVLISRIRDASPRPFQPSDGRPMPPSVPPATTLPQDEHGEG